MTACSHDFRAVGDGRIFCRHCGEYRGSVTPPHVCAPLPCGLPHYPCTRPHSPTWPTWQPYPYIISTSPNTAIGTYAPDAWTTMGTTGHLGIGKSL